jgi:hypothetical protein
VPLIRQNGSTLQVMEVDAVETTTIYDRPWSDAEGELDAIAPEDEGEWITPVAITAVSENEVAVLDPAAERVTCFDLSGTATCGVPLPIPAIGDLFSLGDGTMVVTHFGNRNGEQEATVLRVDPRLEQVETVYHEYPLHVEGFPRVAVNLRFDWDPAATTAWVGLPGPQPVDGPPDATLYPDVDALHLSEPVTRGPTITRTTFGPFWTPSTQWLVDGPAQLAVGGDRWDIAETAIGGDGTTWMLLYALHSDATADHAIGRWVPGDLAIEIAPIERGVGSGTTRALVPLDGRTAAVLDQTATGGRIRTFGLP